MCFTCGCVCLSDGVYSVHAQCSVVFLLSLQGEHHFSQCISDPPPLQNHTWQRVQGAELLQHILPTSLQVSLSTGSQSSGKNWMWCKVVSPWWCWTAFRVVLCHRLSWCSRESSYFSIHRHRRLEAGGALKTAPTVQHVGMYVLQCFGGNWHMVERQQLCCVETCAMSSTLVREKLCPARS